MDERTFEALGLKELVELAARHTQTAPGRARMLSLMPSITPAEIRTELEITSECVAYLAGRGRFGLSGIQDLDPILARIHIEGTSLEPREILAIERLLFVGKEVKEQIKAASPDGCFPHLSSLISSIPDLKSLLTSIHGKILPNGEVDDNASPELKTLRRELTERRHRIHRTLETIFRGQEHAVREEIITFRNGRFVIPVRTDSRHQVPGVVHGLSSSGQTTYVEPMAVINQNNDLVRLREEEAIEVSRILRSITEGLRANIETLRRVLEVITRLDVSQAKALLAVEYECVPPHLSDDGTYHLQDARHILLEHSLRAAGARPVPISVELDEKDHVLVISGPNAGGKTVVLKTAGLLSLMAQMGFHVPAREVSVPVFSQIFADIGDHQSIAANLSTFTAHMRRVAETASAVNPPALLLLDEVGTGTDPDEGCALAIAIIDFFRRKGATTLATTHYPGLKMWASRTPGVRNASVEFDESTLQPTYRLLLGIAGASSGLEIARRMEIPEDILKEAHDLLEPAHAQAREYLRQLKDKLSEQEKLRDALEEERAAVAAKYASLEAEFARKEENRRKEFEASLSRVAEEFKTEADRMVRRVKDQVEAARLRKQAARQAMALHRKFLKLQNASGTGSGGTVAPNNSAPPEEIREGDRVHVRSLDRDGVVELVREGSCIIALGPLRYHAELEDLVKVRSGEKVRNEFRPSPLPAGDEEPMPSELKVIGLPADEARDRVDKFLDQAFLAGLDTVRIIHGHGKGILRKAIAQFLAGHPQVERFGPAAPEKGGSGATVVELRK